ncbi:MAG: helix-turn-helix domain-containing protein, partial [Parachlamydia sp.]|nr:helix-turn-helix domain-containing protein [Parachlamydia sp.]
MTGIAKVATGEWNYKKAIQELGLSKRQLIRMVKRYRQGGASEITHCNRGKQSPKKVSEAQRKLIGQLIRSHYEDFGPTLAA